MRLATIAALLSLLLPGLAGCGAATRGARMAEADLRCGERAYLVEGQNDRAEKCLSRAASGDDASVAAAFLIGDLLDATGRPAEALPYYIRAIEIAHQSGESPAEAEAAAMAIVAIRDRIDDFGVAFDELRPLIGEDPGQLSPQALYQLRNLALGLALRADDPGLTAAVEQTGCLSGWQVAGPIGPRVWELFDEPGSHPEIPAIVDLGPGRGLSERRDIEVSIPCSVQMADPRQRLEGIGIARTVVALDRAQNVHFRLETGGGARVTVGGVEVFVRDPRLGWPPVASWFAARLPAGNTAIQILVADPSAAPTFSLHALDEQGLSLASSHGPELLPTAGPTEPLELTESAARPSARHARLRIALWREDRDSAQRLLERLTNRSGQPAPIHLAAMSEASMTDPALPGETSYERARALMERALAADPSLWLARRYLARHEAMEGREHDAARLLEAGVAIAPDEPELRHELADLAAAAGWQAECARAADELAQLLPSSCRSLRWRLSLARQRNAFAQALNLAREIRACDATSAALAEELTRRQELDLALEEYRRLASRQPDSAVLRFDVARAAAAAGRWDVVASSAAEALALLPESFPLRSTLVDALSSTGREPEARELLEQGLAELPGPAPGIQLLLATLGGERLLDELRVDGLEVFRRYREQAPEYDTASVWVLDRAVHLIGRDGARTELVHSIAHLVTDEAVEQHGELSLPEDAMLLTARTIKADGRVLEPEEIEGKPTISFPDLTPGDFIEVEYAVFRTGSPLFAGGFDTERFYFKDFTTAFHRSEVLVVAPQDLELELDPRGQCPEPEERLVGDMRVITWRAHKTLPLPQEPRAPVAREYLPSIRVTARASWESLTSRIRDMLAEQDRPSPHLDETARQATVGVDGEDHRARRQAIYHWVMEHVEAAGDLFDQPSHIVVRKSGNRARAFVALLRSAGYSGRLALVREAGEDRTDSSVPSLAMLGRVAVHVEDDGWVSLEQDGAPYGYLPAELRHAPVLFIDNDERTSTDGGAVPVDAQRVTLDITLHEDGSAVGTITEELTGVLAAGWRSDLREIAGAEIEKRFEERYLSTAVVGAALSSLTIKELDDPEAPLILEYEIEVPQLGLRDEHAFGIEVPFPITLVKRVGGLPSRSTPAVLASYVEKEVDATIHLPDGFSAKTRTSRATARSKWGDAESQITIAAGLVRAGYKARLHADRIAPAEYVDFIDFAHRIDRATKLEFRAFPPSYQQVVHNNLTR
jgi:tetratricopeptide (TPR) repeat protein